MTSEMLKAARMLLRWGQKDLALASGVSLPTIKRLEAKPGPLAGYYATIKVMQRTLEEAGIAFVDPDAAGGAGVRIRQDSPLLHGVTDQGRPQIRGGRDDA